LFDLDCLIVYTEVYIIFRGDLILKTAKVFKSGNSQAVRLPKEFQLKEKELSIVLKDGALILRPIRKTWKEYFESGKRFNKDFPEHIEDPVPEERSEW
jgi:antitoxin VapB